MSDDESIKYSNQISNDPSNYLMFLLTLGLKLEIDKPVVSTWHLAPVKTWGIFLNFHF
jgi:hypothetical protein